MTWFEPHPIAVWGQSCSPSDLPGDAARTFPGTWWDSELSAHLETGPLSANTTADPKWTTLVPAPALLPTSWRQSGPLGKQAGFTTT